MGQNFVLVGLSNLRYHESRDYMRNATFLRVTSLAVRP
jgi:hypothetical protein